MGAPLRVSAKLPSAGPAPAELGVPAMARRLEAAGFAGVWCSDHVVMTERYDRSHYPFSVDGAPGWDVTTPWYDAVVVMSQAAAVTERVEIGCAVLVLPLRHPVVLAKQMASLDRLAGGRVALGVGAGWFREEFEALGLDFDARGRRLDEALQVLRDAWTGRPPAFEGEHVRVPAGVIHEPTPVRRVPVLVGGMSAVALRRAAAQDGWLALQRAGGLDPDEVAAGVARLRAAAGAQGRDPAALRVVLRIIESQGRAGDVAAALPALRRAGVDEIVVDTDWTVGDEREVHEVLASASAAA